MQSSIIREGADREGMQGVLTLGGRGSQAQVGALLMPGRYISERLVLYSQSHFVPLEGEMWKARPQNKGQLMVAIGEVNRKGNSLKRKWFLEIRINSRECSIWPRPSFVLWTCSARSLYRNEESQFLKFLL